MAMQVYNHLRAPNDVNGNARRLFVVYQIDDKGPLLLGVVDEGCRGKAELHKRYPEAHHIGTYGITATEYRDYIRTYGG